MREIIFNGIRAKYEELKHDYESFKTYINTILSQISPLGITEKEIFYTFPDVYKEPVSEPTELDH